MIQYFSVKDAKLVSADSPDQASIIRLIAPDVSEISQISQLAQAPDDFLAAACDRDERPRIEKDEGVSLIVLRVPYEEIGSDIPVITVAFGVVLTSSHIVLVCSVDLPVLEAIGKSRLLIPPAENRLQFLCAMFMNIARLYLSHLQRIRTEADAVEREIHLSMRNEMLIRMLNLEKCLVYFTTSLRGHESLWGRLRRIWGPELSEDEQDLIEDVQIEFKQAHDLAEIHSNILTGMMDAFASVISNNLNVVMKLLTSITIILMLPTLTASIYGMNVPLPFQDSPHAFLITMAISFIMSMLGVVLFLKKKFF
ncbi:MAG TPA: magnesium transporter CorA family protein [Candidatus Rifleibacterium sp.]|nr:magnesium transporter CorA family protein [Candidatus Rifleibacterium sp.]HPT44266.1 magnesium transporter CorA family protein [Candidatus Rifleibacterium sp.]